LRYSRIFQRSDEQTIGIKVACIIDRDIPPKEAGDYTYEVKRRKTGIVKQESLLSDSRKTEDEYTLEEIQEITSQKRASYQGGDVEVFVSGTWTLEYELALSCLKHLLHRSILIAKHIKNNSVTLSLEEYKKVYVQSDADFKQWKEVGKSDAEIAVEIYSPLERDIVSKAVVAQILSKLLLRSKIKSEKIVADPNLQYLINAIKHAANV
jgi:putative ATP-dependent endonuclease of OLD family